MADVIALVSALGYFGVFLSSLIGAASIFLPLPSFALVIAACSQLDPFWCGTVSGFGAAIGEMTSYGLGFGIYHLHRKIRKGKGSSKKIAAWKKTFDKWFRHHMGFPLVVIFALTPLPDDIIGIFCGAVKYDFRKFFAAVLIGKILLGLALAYGGVFGVELLDRFFK